MDLADLLTEQHRPELADLDLRSTGELVELMIADQRMALEAIARMAPGIETAIDAIVGQLRQGGRLVYVGAGTAGRLGLLDAAECPPTFNTDQVIGILAGGEEAFLVSKEAVEDDAEQGAADVAAAGVGELDAVVGLAASGRTPYTLGAVKKARELGAVTAGISCNPESKLSGVVEYPIEVIVGPEIIAGSTRLKAGTAQKVVLNIISTIVMVRLGKTLGNLMVDVRATNDKLRDRARRIVVQATGATATESDAALHDADGDVKVAILILLKDIDAVAARTRLESHEGVVRNALGEE